MKKLLKNKVFVLAFCVAIVSCTYFIVQKAIDEYTFKTNGDIIREDEGSYVESDNSVREETADSGHDGSGMVAEEDVDLVLEGTDENGVPVEDVR